MRSLLFIFALGLGMALPVAIYATFGSTVMLTAGLLAVIGLIAALCLSVETARGLQSDEGGIE